MSDTLYAQIARQIADRIRAGAYPVGSLLPTEIELGEEFGVSRQTVRAALSELQRQELVSRKKRAGTRVEASVPIQDFHQSLMSIEDLMQLGATHKRALQSIGETVADAAMARLLMCPLGTPWLKISSVRTDENKPGEPIAWTDTYTDPAYAELESLIAANPDKLISSLIEQRYGRKAVNVRQEIFAATIPAEQARPLGVTTGSPALKIVRHYFDEGHKAFEITVSLHPADRFTFVMNLQRAAN